MTSDVMTLPPYAGVSGYLDTVYPASMVAERAVYLEIQATGLGVAAVGMEAGDGFAALVPALRNPEWIQ